MFSLQQRLLKRVQTYNYLTLTKTTLSLITILFTIILSGCGSNGFPTSESGLVSERVSSGQNTMYPSQTSLTAFKQTLYPTLRENCAACHSSDTQGIPPLHSDLDSNLAHTLANKLVFLQNPTQSRLVARLAVDRHNCFEGLNCADSAILMQQAIAQWAETAQVPAAKQPGLEAPFNEETLGELIINNRNSLPLEDQAFAAYISLHQAYNEGANTAELELHRIGLSKALNAVARYAPTIVNPTPIENLKLIYRIDIRNYWENNTLESTEVWERIRQGVSSNFQKGLSNDYIDACQLAYNISRPRVYNRIMELPRFASTLESQLKVVKNDGIDSYKFFTVKNKISINENDRIVWLAKTEDGRQYWRSMDAFAFLNPNLFSNPILGFDQELSQPIRVPGSAAEIIFEMPNGMDGYYIAGAFNQRRLDAFTFVVCDPSRGGPCNDRVSGEGDLRLINGASCMDCHKDGMKYMIDELTPFVAENPNRFDEAEQARIAELYPGQAFLDSAIAQGRERFLDAMDEIIQGMAMEVQGYVRIDEPINALARCAMKRYDYSMSESN